MKIKILVGILIFVLVMVVEWVLLEPDPTPKLLTAQAWLPSPTANSELLNQRNNQDRQGENTSVDFETFKKMNFEQSDVVGSGPNTDLVTPYLDYFGRKKDGKFHSTVLSANQILPVRPFIYGSDWKTYNFDRQTGTVRVTSELAIEFTLVIMVFVAAVLALSLAVFTPESVGKLVDWVIILACGGLNVLPFYYWQTGRQGYTNAAYIFTFWAGVMALWCFLFAWKILRVPEPGQSRGAKIMTDDFPYSLGLLAIGVLVETLIITSIFGARTNLLDDLWLSILLAVSALIINIFAAALTIPELLQKFQRLVKRKKP